MNFVSMVEKPGSAMLESFKCDRHRCGAVFVRVMVRDPRPAEFIEFTVRA